MRRWRDQHKDQVLAQSRKWAESNREHLRSLKRQSYEARLDWYRSWRSRNPERAREYQRAYDKQTQEERRLRESARRARQRGATVGPIDMGALWTGLCGICTEAIDPALSWPDPLSKSVDHVVPLVAGGGHVQSNLQWAHLVCNVRKGARVVEPAHVDPPSDKEVNARGRQE